MKILILNGCYSSDNDRLLYDIINNYRIDGNEVESLRLEDMNIAYCIGCWNCWLKTPGRCIHEDDTQVVLKKVINSDMVISFTENSLGFITSLSKKVLEKFIPLIHPYIQLVDGEFHHEKRYDKYPKFGLIYVDNTMNTNDFNNTKTVFERTAINFHTKLTLATHVSGKEGLNYEDISL